MRPVGTICNCENENVRKCEDVTKQDEIETNILTGVSEMEIKTSIKDISEFSDFQIFTFANFRISN